MSKQIEALKLALEWYDSGKEDRQEFETLMRSLLAEQPVPPPECQTEAEKTAFAFGWWKALEQKRKADSALDRMADNARELGLDYEPAQQQEPVAHCRVRPLRGDQSFPTVAVDWVSRPVPGPLYTSPQPSKPWVGLEEQDMPDGENPMYDDPRFIAGMVWANNKLREKNNG